MSHTVDAGQASEYGSRDLFEQEFYRLAERYGSDGLGTGGLRGYLSWLIRAHPRVYLEVLVELLPRANSWDEFTKRCEQEGWRKDVAPAIRQALEECQKSPAAKQSKRKVKD